MLKKNVRLYAAFCSVFVLLQPSVGRSESSPKLDLKIFAEEFDVVLNGELEESGCMIATISLFGVLPAGCIQIESAQETYKKLTDETGLNRPVEVIAFLKMDQRHIRTPVWHTAGLIGISGDDVYLLQDEYYRYSRYNKSETFTKSSLIQTIQETIEIVSHQKDLFALPRSNFRTQEIIKSLLKKPETYLVDRTARAFHDILPEEEETILEIFRKTTQDQDRIALLELAGKIPLSPSSFNELSPFVNRNFKPEIRREAIRAISKINQYRSEALLAPFLSFEENQLSEVIAALTPFSDTGTEPLRNEEAVPAIIQFSDQLRLKNEADRYLLTNLTYAFLHLVRQYGHPSLIPILANYAFSDSLPYWGQSLSYLSSLTGLQFTEDQREQWELWWRTALPLLSESYDLSSRSGQLKWLAAFHKADAATQKILLRLWFFQPEINELSLLNLTVCEKADCTFQSEAKIAMKELWQQRGLTPETKKSLVGHFLKMSLVEVYREGQAAEYRYLKINSSTAFQFPRNAWVESRSNIVYEDQIPSIDRQDFGGGSTSLGDSADRGFGSIVGWAPPSAAFAAATVEIFEVDYQHGGKILWTLDWKMGPIALQSRKE